MKTLTSPANGMYRSLAQMIEEEWHEEPLDEHHGPIRKVIGYRGAPPHFNDADFGTLAVEDAEAHAISVPPTDSES